MYVQVLLIKIHRRAAEVAAMSALLSEWHKSRCSSEIGVQGQRSKVTTFQSKPPPSETQPKWLVQRSSGGKGKLLGQTPLYLYLGYTKERYCCIKAQILFFPLIMYRLLLDYSDVGHHQKVKMVRS